MRSNMLRARPSDSAAAKRIDARSHWQRRNGTPPLHASRFEAQPFNANPHRFDINEPFAYSRIIPAYWPFPKARGSNTKHYILPLGMANRMRLRMRMDSQSQSHALSRGGCVLQRSCLSSLAAGQTGGGLRLPIKLNYV